MSVIQPIVKTRKMETGKARKTATVEFIKLSIKDIDKVYEFIYGQTPYPSKSHEAASIWDDKVRGYIQQNYMPLKTLESGEGTQNAHFGDYILKGIDGECWPIKADIFNRTYEVINQVS